MLDPIGWFFVVSMLCQAAIVYFLGLKKTVKYSIGSVVPKTLLPAGFRSTPTVVSTKAETMGCISLVAFVPVWPQLLQFLNFDCDAEVCKTGSTDWRASTSSSSSGSGNWEFVFENLVSESEYTIRLRTRIGRQVVSDWTESSPKVKTVSRAVGVQRSNSIMKALGQSEPSNGLSPILQQKLNEVLAASKQASNSQKPITPSGSKVPLGGAGAAAKPGTGQPSTGVGGAIASKPSGAPTVSSTSAAASKGSASPKRSPDASLKSSDAPSKSSDAPTPQAAGNSSAQAGQRFTFEQIGPLDVELTITLPPFKIVRKNIEVKMLKEELEVCLTGLPILKGKLEHPINLDESTWQLEDGKVIVTLVAMGTQDRSPKMKPGAPAPKVEWKKVIVS